MSVAFVAKRLVDVAFVITELVAVIPLTAISPLTVSEPVMVVDATSRDEPVMVPPVKVESVIAPFANVEPVILLSIMSPSLTSP